MSMINAEGDNLGPLFYDETIGAALPSATELANQLQGEMAGLGMSPTEAIVSRGADYVQVYIADLGPHRHFRAGRRHELRIDYRSSYETGAYVISIKFSRLSPREVIASETSPAGPPSEAFVALDAGGLLQRLLSSSAA